MATTQERFRGPLARVASEKQRMRKAFLDVAVERGDEFVSALQELKTAVSEDLQAGIERDVLADFMAKIVADTAGQADEFKKAVAYFGDAPRIEEQLEETNRILDWFRAVHKNASAPLKPFDMSKLPPRTSGPKSEGFVSGEDALKWLDRK